MKSILIRSFIALFSLALTAPAVADSSQNTPDGPVNVVVMPDALQKMAVADNTTFGFNLNVGTFTGLTLQVKTWTNGNLGVSVEGNLGAMYFFSAYGGGVRAHIKAVEGKRNALVISPGIDLMYSPETKDTYFWSHDKIYFVATDADVAWLHQFSPHFGFELGSKLGGLIAFDKDTTVAVPQISLFSGIRF